MKRRILFILILLLLFFPFLKVSASELCSSNGYTILTVNGIFNDEQKALNNKKNLERYFLSTYNNQPLKVDFLYNPTHLAGLKDLVDAVQQGLFDEKSDYDLVEMLDDASQKVTTQKLLLVAHSQGNFYANNFYDKVVSKPGGVPSESIGMYGVASPADRVAGGGKYLTSDTDSVIAAKVGRFLKILPPNINIPLQSNDGNGHSFADVYLKYQGARIVSDIKSSLNKLQTNNIQDSQKPCIDPPKLSILHKVEGAMLAVADPLASFTKTVAVGTVVGAYNTSLAIGNGVIHVAVATANFAYNTSLAVGNATIRTVQTAGSAISSVYSFTKSIFNDDKVLAVNNTASVISAVDQMENISQDLEQVLIPVVVVSNKIDSVKIIENTTIEETPTNVIVEEIPSILVIEPVIQPVIEPSVQIIQNTPATGAIPRVVHGGGGNNNIEPVNENPPLPPDTTSPIITILGDNIVSIDVGSLYADAGATALDDVDGVVSTSSSGTVDTAVVGTYTITYTASDIAENVATLTRTVNVVALPIPPDTTAPVISIAGNNIININVGDAFIDAGATALDDVDGVVNVSSSGVVDNWMAGNYTITYTAKDNANNTATATRTINVTDVISEIALSSSDLNNNGIEDNTENDVVMDSDMSLPAGEYRFNNLTIANNAVLTLSGDLLSANSFKGVKITAVNLNINSGSSISADKKGYRAGTGPGASSEDSVGASYGGFSLRGEAFSTTYGSAKKPIDLGSGGAHYYYDFGGGAIRIVVSDIFTNDGIISSNGGEAGSGGSIFVTANNIAGNGKFQANGGKLYASGYFKSPGGGGRIAIYYKTSTFSGTTEAKGGCGSYDGWSASCGQNGTIGIFNNSTNDIYVNNSWKFLQNDAPFSFNNIYVLDNTKVTSEDGVSVTANNISINNNSFFTFSNNQILNAPIISVDGNSTLTLFGNETIQANTLNINGNSIVTVIPEKILFLNIPNINIEEGSSITADEKGYPVATGPGAPSAIYDSENEVDYIKGASYGGLGYRNVESSIYGSMTTPTDFGSGGNGYHPRGGGAIRLITENLVNNGLVSASGSNTSSGGSVYVTTNTFDGAGVFQANGGGSYCPNSCYGPGGGGRVAIYHKGSSFIGQIIANGWSGWGGESRAGTVHIVDESILPQ